MTHRGGSVRVNQTGVSRSMRTKSVVSAGRVVADVAVCWVERKSVKEIIGSSRTLHREVNTFSVSTISSKLF
jgi:hypothetical protein